MVLNVSHTKEILSDQIDICILCICISDNASFILFSNYLTLILDLIHNKGRLVNKKMEFRNVLTWKTQEDFPSQYFVYGAIQFLWLNISYENRETLSTENHILLMCLSLCT